MKAKVLLNKTHFLCRTSKKDLLLNIEKYLIRHLHFPDAKVTLTEKNVLKVEVVKKEGEAMSMFLCLDCGCLYPTEYYGEVSRIYLDKNDLSNVVLQAK